MKTRENKDARELFRIFSGWGIVILGGAIFLGGFVGMVLAAALVRTSVSINFGAIGDGILGLLAVVCLALREIKQNE